MMTLVHETEAGMRTFGFDMTMSNALEFTWTWQAVHRVSAQLHAYGHGNNKQTHNEALLAGQLLGYTPGVIGTPVKARPGYQDPVGLVHGPYHQTECLYCCLANTPCSALFSGNVKLFVWVPSRQCAAACDFSTGFT